MSDPTIDKNSPEQASPTQAEAANQPQGILVSLAAQLQPKEKRKAEEAGK